MYKAHNMYMKHFCSARSRCEHGLYKNYGVKFELTEKDVKFLWDRDDAMSMKKPSIDRIDTCGNYTLSNCRFIECSLNKRLPRRKSTTSSNPYKGVYYQKDHKKYRALVIHNGKQVHCGYFSNPLDAAKVYDIMISKLFGDEININKTGATYGSR